MTNPHQLLDQRLAALCLLLAPLFETVEAALSPLRGGSTAADIVAIQAHQGRFTVSVLVGIVAIGLYVPAFLGVSRLTAARSRHLTATAVSLLVLAMLGFTGVRMGQAFELAAVHRHMAPATAGGLLDATPGTIPGAAIMITFLAGSTLGIWLLSAALWRARAVPRPAALLVAAFPLIDLGLHGHISTVASHVVLLVGLSFAGAKLIARDPAASPMATSIDPMAAGL